ncbi:MULTISPECIES: hypothetical protein [Rodentibacter]|nr:MULTISPECIES: hypothetical protein [Rodentibacter]AOF52240.1 hypothetical protein AC062_0140 [Pasteurellaceae bacterium NI1060]MCX2962011.1 hypothetical protein [Rodentibacter heylii]
MKEKSSYLNGVSSDKGINEMFKKNKVFEKKIKKSAVRIEIVFSDRI